jgi:dTDP-glucose pyrophosphorylase
MIINSDPHLILDNLTVRSSIKVLNDLELKILFVVDGQNKLIGTVTDGDIRRAILQGVELDEPIHGAMQKDFVKYYDSDDRANLDNEILEKSLQAIPVLFKDGTIKEIHASGFNTITDKKNTIVLMAGGFGSRLKPLTDECPKPLLQVGEKPIIETIIQNFLSYGYKKFIISTHYKSEMIKDYLGDGSKYNCSISYIEENNPLGTAGCLSLINSSEINEPFFVMNADILTKVNFKQLIEFHQSSKAKITMCVRNFYYDIPYGVVSSKNSYVKSIDEKPKISSKVNAGIYVLDSDLLNNFPKDLYMDMPSLINETASKKESSVAAFPIYEYWLDIGQIGDYKRAQIDFISNFLNEK